MPLGNVTNQLFTNIYLDAFDHFVKEQLRLRWYVRFCDDFVIVHPNRDTLEAIVSRLQTFLTGRRMLILHPNKVSIRKLLHGVDFIGQVARPYYRVIRTKTKRRVFQRMHMKVKDYLQGLVSDEEFRQSLQSSRGVFQHGSNYKVCEELRSDIWQAFLKG